MITPGSVPRVLAISSGGGHWVQLLRVAPAFEGCEVCFVTVRATYRDDIPFGRFRTIVDATRWNKIKLARMALKIALIVLLERPNTVISTGAAPGYFAFRFARLLGARTIWLDSIANAEQLSMTGRMVEPHADLWLTQWEHLAGPDGPTYGGSVV
jgi:UDP-N-acetylglucosamine:LPS N-acetylglucosamine transferase